MVEYNITSLSTTLVTISNDDGTTKELHRQEDMEEAIREENRRKYHQKELAHFYSNPIVSCLVILQMDLHQYRFLMEGSTHLHPWTNTLLTSFMHVL